MAKICSSLQITPKCKGNKVSILSHSSKTANRPIIWQDSTWHALTSELMRQVCDSPSLKVVQLKLMVMRFRVTVAFPFAYDLPRLRW